MKNCLLTTRELALGLASTVGTRVAIQTIPDILPNSNIPGRVSYAKTIYQ